MHEHQFLVCGLELARLEPHSYWLADSDPGVLSGGSLAVVHPEFLELGAEGASTQTTATWSGTLERRRFFGHDRIEEVRLDNGQTVKVRLTAEEQLPLGSRVVVRLRRAPTRVF